MISRSFSSIVLLWVLVWFFITPGEAQRLPSSSAYQSNTLGFAENKGQVRDQFFTPRPDVHYLYESPGMNIQFRTEGFSYDLFSFEESEPMEGRDYREGREFTRVHSHRIDVFFVNSNPDVRILSEGRSRDYLNYCLGELGDISQVYRFQTLTYQEIYPGIDIVLYAQTPGPSSEDLSAGFKYDIIVKPGGNISDVRFRIAGATGLHIDESGALVIGNTIHNLVETIPRSYLMQPGEGTTTRDVRCSYTLADDIVSFTLDTPQGDDILVIDPQLVWGTYYGSRSTDRAYEICWANAAKTAFAFSGRTTSTTGIATSGTFQSSFAGNEDAFIAKFDVDGNRIWASYFGGPGREAANTVYGDGLGNLYLGGITTSSGLATPGTHKQSVASEDGFIVKFTAQGQRIWSTYIGGTSNEEVYGVTMLGNGNIVVGGWTLSANFEATPGAFQSTSGGGTDCFVASFDSSGTLRWGTYFGGNGAERIYTIAPLPNNEFVACGDVRGSDLGTPGSYQPTPGGAMDGFILVMDDAGQRKWSTHVGGNGDEIIRDVGTDALGNIFVGGYTTSTSGIATPGTHQQTFSGLYDAMLFRFTQQGQRVWGTYFGGSGYDQIYGVDFDQGKFFIAGETTSPSGIASPGSHQETLAGDYDAFLADFTLDGNLICSTYYGGSNKELAYDMLRIASNEAIMIGETVSASGISTPGSHEPDYLGSIDVFAVRMHSACSTSFFVEYPNVVVCDGDSVRLAGGIAGGIPPYTYHWSPAFGLSATNIMNPVAAPFVTTTYYVEVWDSSGQFATDSVTVTVAPNPVAEAGPDTLLCANSPGTLHGSVSSGTPPYIVRWSPPTGLSSPFTLTTGVTPAKTTTYHLIIIDANGCVDTDSVTVTVNPILTANAGPDVTLCKDGSATIGRAVTGGTPPVTHYWTPQTGLADPTAVLTEATPTQTTTYILTAIDSVGCVSTDTVTVSIADGMVVDAGPDRILCFGESAVIGNYPTIGAPPFDIVWTPAAGLSNPTVARPIASPDSTTTYIVTITDKNGCTGSDTITVTVGEAFIASAGPDISYCGGGTATLEGSVTGGKPPYTYSWTPPNAIYPRNVLRPVANPLVTTTYILCVTDSLGCTDCDTVTVFVGPGIDIDAGPDRYLCNDGSVTLRATIAGGTTPHSFTWTPTDGLSSPTQFTTVAHPMKTTTYVVTVIDASGCIDRDTVTVFVSDAASFDAGPHTSICRGDTVLLGREADFGNPPYTYSWSPPLGLRDTSGAIVAASPGITTTYIVTVRDASGCVAEDTITVTVYEPPQVNAEGGRIICEGDTVQLHSTATGGTPPYTYAWTPEIALSDPAIADPLAWPTVTTKYTIRVTDANGCSAVETVVVVVNPLPDIHITPGGAITLCEGDSVALTASGGMYTYEWSNGDTTQTIVVRVGGVYRVRITSADGCTAISEDVTVNILPGLSPEIIGPIVLCERDSIVYRVEPIGMDSYQWTIIGGTIISGNGTERILVNWGPNASVGILEVIVGHGPCFGRDTLEVLLFDSVEPTLDFDGRTILCEGSSLTLHVNGTYARYYWSTGDTTTSITVRSSGEYYVWVEDSLGCNGYSDTIRVTESHLPGVQIEGMLVLCGQLGTTLTATGGFMDYFWSTGEMTQEIVVTAPGVYTVTAVDSNGCTSYDEVEVVRVPGLVPEIVGDSVLCEGESAVLSVKGEYPDYLWSTGETTRTIRINQPGTYWVRIHDGNGCVGDDTLWVTGYARTDIVLESLPITADPGTLVTIRLVITAPDYTTLGTIPYEGVISFERSALAPLTHGYEDHNGRRYISFSGIFDGSSEVLLEVPCMALLGDTDSTSITLDEIRWNVPCVFLDYIEGVVAINICEEGGKRLVSSRQPTLQATITPNPFTGQTAIRYTIAEASHILMVVKDMLGRTVVTLADSHHEPGVYTAIFDATHMPSGVFYYIIHSDHEHIIGTMRSVK